MHSLSRERGLEDCRFPLWPAADDREVFLFDLAALHRETKVSRRRRIFRDQHQSARLPVEPVDDRHLTTVDQLEGEQLPQGRPECWGSVGFARVDKEERGLVHHDVIFRLRHNAELGRQACAVGRGG